MRLFQRPARGWRRDLRTWIVAVFGAYVLFGFFGVPAILRSQVPRMVHVYAGRDAKLTDASFNPFTLKATLSGFDLRDKDGTPLAAFGRLVVNLQASSPFRRAWTFREIRLEQPKVVVRIGADGRLAIADLFEKKPDPQPQKPFKLPRALIFHLAIDSGSVTFQDDTVSPRFESSFEPLSVNVSKLSTIPDREGGHVITVGIEGRGELRWSGHMSMEPLRLEGQLDLALRKLDRVWQYAGRSLPILLTSGESHVSVPYRIEKPEGRPMRVDLHDVAFDTTGLAIRPRDAEADWARFARIDFAGGSLRWPERTVDVSRLKVTGPSAEVWRTEDGAVNWATLYQQFTASRPPPGNAPPADSSPAWHAAVRTAEVEQGTAQFEDRTVTPPVKIAVTEFASRVLNITSDGATPLDTHVSAKVDESGTFTSEGPLSLKPVGLDFDVAVSGAQIPALQAYLAPFVHMKVVSGTAGSKGKLSFHPDRKPFLRFDGRTSLDNLAINDLDGERIAAWGGLAVEGIRFTLEPNAFRVKSVDVVKPFAQALIDKNGKLSIQKLFVSRPPDAAPAKPEAASSAGPPFDFEIAAIRLHDGTIQYADESLLLPFKATIREAGGSLTDLSSKSAAGSRLSFEGKVDEHGYAKIDGTLRVFDPFAASDLHVLFRNVEMTALTPYTAQFAGYAIQEGRLDLQVDYAIHDRALVGNHKLTATSLTLGEKVPGAKSSLPLRLAIALLKDSQGKIELAVPIEGSVDDPEFGYRAVIWQAFKRVMVNITTAPFRFLGKMFGYKGDELETVSFEAGRSTLLPPEKEKLDKLASALQTRPGLSLQVGGRFDPVADAAALKQDKLDALIESRRKTTAGDDEAAAIDRILDALYRETHTREERQAQESKRTANPAAYYEDIRRILREAQSVGDDELQALARARSEAITAELAGSGAVDASRITASGIEPVTKKTDERLIPCKLAMPSE